VLLIRARRVRGRTFNYLLLRVLLQGFLDPLTHVVGRHHLLVGAVLPAILGMGEHGGALGALEGQVWGLWVASGLGQVCVVAGVVVLILILKILLLL
jgi:hypothetical protein